ncbi:atad3-a [Symbiodinium natans]|uniref:Atad3-a protein n=1 Tax=Symbiodinium natans TaxID=878477 RepID=A0A812TGN2_9DINO|nr:atad3-a [Symbiodinium natans]
MAMMVRARARALLAQLLLACLIHARASDLKDLLVATARGATVLKSHLSSSANARSLLSEKDEFGFSSLTVATYIGDAYAAELLVKEGAVTWPGEITAFMGDAPVKLGSIVELAVRRSSMLIMLGTGFKMPAYLHEAQKKISVAKKPSPSSPEVPDMARTLEVVAASGAQATEKSQEEGADLARAAYFLDSSMVEVLLKMGLVKTESGFSKAASRALIAVVLGIGQLKHRLNRALLQQPRMAGRLFRDYYGFDIESEAKLLSPTFQSMSFEDTLRMVNGKAILVAESLLKARADPSFAQSKQSGKTPLHHCAEHGLSVMAEVLLAAKANPETASRPLRRTPLHQAVVHRSLGVLRALLDSGARTSALDSAGRTAMDLVKKLGWAEGQQQMQLVTCHGSCPAGDVESEMPLRFVHLPELLPAGWHHHWQQGHLPDWGGADTQTCEIAVMKSEELSADAFVDDYLSLRRPLLVRGGAKQMPAFERWSLRYLMRKVGETPMSAVTIPYPEDFGDVDAKDARRLPLKEYVTDVMGKVNSSSGTPLYVFSVVEQEDPTFKKLLGLVQKDATPHPSWMQESGKLRYRLGNIQFGLGPPGSGAPQHYHTHAYATLFRGRKQWLFYPPPTSSLSRQHAIQAMRQDQLQRQEWRSVKTLQEAVARKSQHPLYCEQGPGDIVYVPTDWGHLTYNTDISLSISRVRLREMRARMAEERKTRLEQIQAVFAGLGAGTRTLLEDRSKMTVLVGGLTALALGVYGARAATGVAGNLIERRLMRPPLVRETSRMTWGRDGLASFISSKKQGGFLEKIVLEDDLSERLQWTTNSLVNAKKNGTPYRHLLLHGPPGTGKTLFARTLARQSGLDYAIMSGGDVGPLGKDAVHELNKLFSWANSSRRGLILFIDEADAFLRTGRGSDTGSMSEEARNVLSAFLHHTGTESDKFVVVLATNIREILDRAVLDRIDENFEFPLPSLEERKRMLAMFMEEHIHTPTKRGKVIEVDQALDDSFLEQVAKRTDGFSGRQLAKLVLAYQAAVFGSGTTRLTPGLAETVLQYKLIHREDITSLGPTVLWGKMLQVVTRCCGCISGSSFWYT